MPEQKTIRRLDDQVAIITGGTGGIGRAAAAALLEEGASVVIVGRTPDRVERVAAELHSELSDRTPPPVLGLALDVRSETDMETMVQRTLERYGRVDILVTCAGLGRPSQSGGGIPSPVSQLSVAAWDEMINTNLKGVFLSNRAVLRPMLACRRGQIINISSARGAVSGQPYGAAYCASKFGLMGLAEALAEEVRASGIRVQTLMPDAVDTPLLGGTTLAPGPGDALPASTVAAFIVTMLTLPDDTILVNPLMAPMRAKRKRSSKGRGAPSDTPVEEGRL
jgi:NAD(P)-dependent dehydrogenase (short-subunit alcohol dehydrogenase family)